MNEEFVNEEEKEFNVYGDQAREELTANDEIDSDEDGFMKGYESEANPVYCDNCKKILERDHIEKENWICFGFISFQKPIFITVYFIICS